MRQVTPFGRVLQTRFRIKDQQPVLLRFTRIPSCIHLPTSLRHGREGELRKDVATGVLAVGACEAVLCAIAELHPSRRTLSGARDYRR